MTRDEFRLEVNRVLGILLGVAVVAGLGLAIYAASEEMNRVERARIESDQKHRDAMWKAEAALKGYRSP